VARTIAAIVAVLLHAPLAAGCAGAAGSVVSPPVRTYAADSPHDDAGPPREGPHDSVEAFLDAHFSSVAWREDVGRGYLTTSSVLLPASLAVGALAIAPWDHEIASNTGDSSTALGDATLTALLLGTASVGIFAPGEGRDGAEERWTIGEAFAVDLAATELLKTSVGRRRPGSDRRTSFASGHTSLAFTAATLIDRNSGHGLGIPAYALAAATGVSRVASGRHFPSDVFAGAAIGALSAGIVDSLHFGGEEKGEGISRRRSASGDIGVEIGPDGRPLLALTIHF